jgi:hypothetical protein
LQQALWRPDVIVLGHDSPVSSGVNFSPTAAPLLPQGFTASIAVLNFSAVLQDI